MKTLTKLTFALISGLTLNSAFAAGFNTDADDLDRAVAAEFPDDGDDLRGADVESDDQVSFGLPRHLGSRPPARQRPMRSERSSRR